MTLKTREARVAARCCSTKGEPRPGNARTPVHRTSRRRLAQTNDR